MSLDLEPQDDGSSPSDAFDDWYGFDTENNEKGRVTIAALIHESGSSTIWRKAGGFIKWCDQRLHETPKRQIIVICHNLEYDLVNEFGVDKYCEMGLNYLKGKLISAKLGNITFRDSFNHFRMKLADIGEAIGISKLRMDINSSEYVTTDAWICLKVMTQARDYIASLGGRIGATSGSSSLSVWKYMTDGEFCTGPHDTPWMRQGYYGGRTEVFRPHTFSRFKLNPDGTPKMRQLDVNEEEWFIKPMLGKQYYAPGEMIPEFEQDIRGYDINSMFPFCMLNDYPEYWMDDPRMSKVKGLVEATITVPKDLFVAPVVHRAENGQLLYPVGVFRGVWTYDEMQLVQQVGGKILTVHKAIGCSSMVRPFDQFINTLYAKRKTSKNESERLFLKVLMNSLYGKLASKNEVTRTVSRYNLLKNNNKRIEDVKWINYNRGLLDYKTPQQDYVNVIWGAMITAYARNLLTRYMMKVPANDLIYCDTDSIYCRNYTLPESKELGGMKLEKSSSIMEVVQPKAYRLDDFWKAKGVPRPRTTEHPSGSKTTVDFARQYMVEGFTSFAAPIRFRASLNSHRGRANQWVTHSKSMKSEYKAKPLSGDRYVPPVLSAQLDLPLATARSKAK
jgi:hypothetical protein